MSEQLLISTRKGLITLNRRNDGWTPDATEFPGVPVMAALRDPADGAIYAALKRGHFGRRGLATRQRAFTAYLCGAVRIDCQQFLRPHPEERAMSAFTRIFDALWRASRGAAHASRRRCAPPQHEAE